MNPSGERGTSDLTRFVQQSFLDAEIGIEHYPGVAIPKVAVRRRIPQFATARFCSCGFNHPRAQNAEFELADAALHAKKQPVIRMARVVDAVMVHDTRIYHAAKLQLFSTTS